ncbi:MAG TPA: homoserine kinase [Actinopolymorphaceae bacterium]
MSEAKFRETPVRVRVPASCGNVGPGFDALGLALGLHDEVEARIVSSGLSVDVSGEGSDSVPRDESHLVVRAMRAAFDAMGGQPPGIALRCSNRIPHARGLGSSAAAIVAGLVAARALAAERGYDWSDDRLLGLATELEGHPDNVAAALLGGLTIAWSDERGTRAIRLAARPVQPVVFVPDASLSTEAARAALPAAVPHRDAATNAARTALLIAALAGDDSTNGRKPVDPDILFAATEDRLHQQYRASAMPRSAALLSELRARRIPAVISGAGPTVLAFAQVRGAVGATVGESTQVSALARQAPPGFRALPLSVDQDGAVVRP